MNDSLAAYLHDHLAGSVSAVKLLESIRDEYAGMPLGEFASTLLVEIEADQRVLRGFADRIGTGNSGVKELTAWLAEKIGRLKLGHATRDGLETFEALEILELGIRGEWALWRALGAASEFDSRLQGADFDYLAARAESQCARVEERRLEVARTALRSANN